MARRALIATPGQVERARAVFETQRDNLGFQGLRPTPSRHTGGDLGRGEWDGLTIEAQEMFVKIGDAVARVVLDQQRRRGADSSTPALPLPPASAL
jgi:hypothetical protein